MSDISVEVGGLGELRAEIEDLERRYGTPTTEFTVGTGVEYAVYLEFGTSKMDPKPFFRPVVASAKAQGLADYVEEHTGVEAEGLDSADDVVEAFALALENHIVDIITRKGLIDTGTLRASVQAVRGGVGATEFPDAEDVDPDASAEVEV